MTITTTNTITNTIATTTTLQLLLLIAMSDGLHDQYNALVLQYNNTTTPTTHSNE